MGYIEYTIFPQNRQWVIFTIGLRQIFFRQFFKTEIILREILPDNFLEENFF